MGYDQVLRNAALIAVTTMLLAVPPPAWADGQSQPAAPVRTTTAGMPLGVQGFGTLAVSLPGASESFEALGMETRFNEFGGGARVTNVWRHLFVEGSVSRWKGSGSRAFIDSRGTRFDLGIPLNVQSTYVDVGAGWRFERRTHAGLPARVVPFIGGGAGVLEYKERSTFAESGEDVAESVTTYSAFGGVEVILTSWLGVSGDVRYRFAKGILGADGVSALQDDDRLSGPAVSVRVMAGRFGTRRAASPPAGRKPPERKRPAAVPPPPTGVREPEPAAAPAPAAPRTSVQEREPPAAAPSTTPVTIQRRRVVIAVAPTPVSILPDASRPPLRVLEARTRMTVVGEEGDWFRVEFRDPQWGVRVGYVEKSRVRASEE